MPSTFQQGQTSSVNNFTGYAWSNAANWTNGVPVNGSSVVFNQGTTANPDGYDNIANLYLDNLTLTQGFIAVTGTLEVGSLAFSAEFGEITATTLPGNSAALLTVDGFANANRGYLEATGAGAVVNVLATTDPGEVYLADGGGEVELTALPSTNSTLQFTASTSAATFALRTAGGTIAAALYDADVGKSIALPGSSVSAVTFGSHSIAITTNLGTTTFSNVYYANGSMPTGYSVSTDPTGLERVTFTAPPCYCPDTLILTQRGEMPVEALEIGDHVITVSGAMEPIRWIGRRSYEGRFIAGNHLMLPVTIRAGALADATPHTDLIVSPGHAIWVDGQLIPAWRLVDGVTITQAEKVVQVTYIHIELPQHVLLLANGAAAESFLDETGVRGQFHNAAAFYSLYPNAPAMRPLQARLEDGFALQSIQERLADRAGVMPVVEPAGALRGFVDHAGPEHVCGWAQDADSPEEPVAPEVLVDGMPVLTVLANAYRADLRKAGLGSGCHAFEISLPVAGAVTVRRTTDGAALTMTKAADERLAA
jgi:hypothetical protein